MAYVQTLIFNYDINVSLQVGDPVYMTSTSPLGGFENNSSAVPIHIGHVHNIISSTEIEVYSEYVDANGDPLSYNMLDSNGGDYISFSKNRVVNNNDLLGYYASVHFVNNSTTEAKLWSVGSGITENSK
tara:strand:- start:1721 stop:2107 length:387 start_codon:yes stop_codon:yes gene_type:complete